MDAEEQDMDSRDTGSGRERTNGQCQSCTIKSDQGEVESNTLDSVSTLLFELPLNRDFDANTALYICNERDWNGPLSHSHLRGFDMSKASLVLRVKPNVTAVKARLAIRIDPVALGFGMDFLKGKCLATLNI